MSVDAWLEELWKEAPMGLPHIDLEQLLSLLCLILLWSSVIVKYTALVICPVYPSSGARTWIPAEPLHCCTTMVLPRRHWTLGLSLVSSPSPVQAFSVAGCCGIQPWAGMTLPWLPLVYGPWGQQALTVLWYRCPQVCLHEMVVYIASPRRWRSTFYAQGIWRGFQFTRFGLFFFSHWL